jgi:hypothetical protein
MARKECSVIVSWIFIDPKCRIHHRYPLQMPWPSPLFFSSISSCGHSKATPLVKNKDSQLGGSPVINPSGVDDIFRPSNSTSAAQTSGFQK